MNPIEILCGEIQRKASSISTTSANVREIAPFDRNNAELLDEVVLEDFEQMQRIVIALGNLLLDTDGTKVEPEPEPDGGQEGAKQ